jgi:hypothetical protein
VTYIPTIYGFKIFGHKGSKYEIMYDNSGQPKNQKDVDGLLKRKIPTSINNDNTSMGANIRIR